MTKLFEEPFSGSKSNLPPKGVSNATKPFDDDIEVFSDEDLEFMSPFVYWWW